MKIRIVHEILKYYIIKRKIMKTKYRSSVQLHREDAYRYEIRDDIILKQLAHDIIETISIEDLKRLIHFEKIDPFIKNNELTYIEYYSTHKDKISTINGLEEEHHQRLIDDLRQKNCYQYNATLKI